VAIDPSGERVLLVSLIPIYGRGDAASLTFVILSFQPHYGHEFLSESTSACGAMQGQCLRGACTLFLTSGCMLIPFPGRLQSMATLDEGDQRQMWEFIRT
jgi:hypothetical protein